MFCFLQVYIPAENVCGPIVTTTVAAPDAVVTMVVDMVVVAVEVHAEVAVFVVVVVVFAVERCGCGVCVFAGVVVSVGKTVLSELLLSELELLELSVSLLVVWPVRFCAFSFFTAYSRCARAAFSSLFLSLSLLKRKYSTLLLSIRATAWL